MMSVDPIETLKAIPNIDQSAVADFEQKADAAVEAKRLIPPPPPPAPPPPCPPLTPPPWMWMFDYDYEDWVFDGKHGSAMTATAVGGDGRRFSVLAYHKFVRMCACTCFRTETHDCYSFCASGTRRYARRSTSRRLSDFYSLETRSTFREHHDILPQSLHLSPHNAVPDA